MESTRLKTVKLQPGACQIQHPRRTWPCRLLNILTAAMCLTGESAMADSQPTTANTNANISRILLEKGRSQTAPGYMLIAAEAHPSSTSNVTPNRKKRRKLQHVAAKKSRLLRQVLPEPPKNVPNVTVTGAYRSATDGHLGENPSQPSQVLSPASVTGFKPGGPPLSAPIGAPPAAKSMDDLDTALGQRQTFSDQTQGRIYRDLVSLQSGIADQQRPIATLLERYSTQSNKLNIEQTELSQTFFFDEGASRLQPGLQYISYAPGVGAGVTQYAVGADGSYRMDDSTAIAGDFWLNSLASNGVSTNIVPTYDVFLTLWPSDYFRIDLDNKREIFDNIISLRQNITAESIIGSVDYTPTDDLRLTLRAGSSFYSDANDRQSVDAELVYRVGTLPTIEIGARVSEFGFSRLLSDGYFNPRNYQSAEAMFQFQLALAEDWKAELDASAGAETANPGGIKPLVKSSFQTDYKLNRNWTVVGSVSYFSSRESNSAGFARTTINVGLNYAF